jgi:electron transfer flavoprotein beta subunit
MLAVAGAATGVLAGIFGVGGGAISVPILFFAFGLIGVEEAIRLKEAGICTEIIVVSLGVPQCQETLRTALAMGADRAILVETDVELQPLAVAKLLKALVDREQPKLAQAAGVTVNGEMVVEYEKRSENINTLTEQQFANLIMRLARGAERTVMSLEGQGGRLIDGKGNHDLGLFGRQLENKGFATGPLNLSLAPAVPDDL